MTRSPKFWLDVLPGSTTKADLNAASADACQGLSEAQCLQLLESLADRGPSAVRDPTAWFCHALRQAKTRAQAHGGDALDVVGCCQLVSVFSMHDRAPSAGPQWREVATAAPRMSRPAVGGRRR